MSIAAQSLAHMDPKILQRAVLGLPTNPKIEPYAALSALQAQNKAARMKQAQAAQAPAATAPVASRTLAEAAELNNPYAAGLGAAPVASPVSEAPVGMAGGGMVAFADGGDVPRYYDGVLVKQKDVQSAYDNWMKAKSGVSAAEPAWYQQATPTTGPNVAAANEAAQAAEARYNQLLQQYQTQKDTSQPGNVSATPTGFEAQTAKQIADLEEKTGRKLSEGAKDALRQQEMAKLLKTSNVATTADTSLPTNAKVDTAPAKDKGSANAGLADAAVARGNRGAGTGAANVGLGAAAGRAGYNLDMPKAQTTEERLAEIDAVKERMGAKNAEYLRPMQEQLDKYAADAKEAKTQGKYEALMQAGLGMMAGKSQYAFQNIGEGGSMGLAALRESNKLNRAAEDKLMTAQNDMVKSRIALEKGDETAAMQFANQGRQEMKDRAMLQLTAQHYANSDAAQMMTAQAAMSRANALGGNEDKHMAALTRVRSALNQDPQYKELAKMAVFKGTMGDNARAQMAEMEKKLYSQLAPELLGGAGGNTMGAGGPQLQQADLALINKYTSPR